MAKGRGGKQKGYESAQSSVFDALFAVRNSPAPKVKPVKPTGISGTSAFADAALNIALAPAQNIGDDVLGEIAGTLGGGKLVEFQLTKGMGPNAGKISVKGSSLAGFLKDPGAIVDKAVDDIKARRKAASILGIPGTNQDQFVGAAAGFITGTALGMQLGSSSKEAEKVGLAASFGKSNDPAYNAYLNSERVSKSAELLARTSVSTMYDKEDPGDAKRHLEQIIQKEFTTYRDPKDPSKGVASLDISQFNAKKDEIAKELKLRGFKRETVDKLMTGMEVTFRDVLAPGHASNTDSLTPNLYREILRKDIEQERRLASTNKEVQDALKKLELISVYDDLYRSGSMDFGRVNERINSTIQSIDGTTAEGKRTIQQLQKQQLAINRYNTHQGKPWNDGKDTKSTDLLRGAEDAAMNARLIELKNSAEFKNGDPAALNEAERLAKAMKYSKYSQSARWKTQALYSNFTAFRTLNSMGWNQVGRFMFMPGKHDDLGIIRPSDGFDDKRHFSLSVGGQYVTDKDGKKVWKANKMISGGVRIERDVAYWMKPVTRMQYFMPGNLIGGLITGNTFKAMATWQTQDFMKKALNDRDLMDLIQNNQNLFDDLKIFDNGKINPYLLAENMDQVLKKLGNSVHGNAKIKAYLSKFKGIQRLGGFYHNTYFKVISTFTGGVGLLGSKLKGRKGALGVFGKFLSGEYAPYDMLQANMARSVEWFFKSAGRGLSKLGFKGLATSVAGLFATPIGGIIVGFLSDAVLEMSKPFLKIFMWFLASLFILPCAFFFLCSDFLQQGNSLASFIPVETPFSVFRAFYGGGGTSQPSTPYNDTDGSYDPGTVIPVGSGYLRGIIDADLIPEPNDSFDRMCPFDGSAPRCTQGPGGTFSHRGYETDLGGSPGNFVAPTDGWIENYIPNVVCEFDGVSNRGGELQFVGCDGTVYQLLHVESNLPRATREQKNCANPQIKQGQKVANMQNIGSYGACWRGMHYHVEIFTSSTVNSFRYLNSLEEHSGNGLNCGITGSPGDGCR